MFSGSSSADDMVNLGGINELDLLLFLFIYSRIDGFNWLPVRLL